jgi:pilus assembly protein FimV
MEVKSQRDEPLLVEIPIISNDPTELEALQARLASPETFARIGLAPPSGIVTDLQFNVASDARGRPVIRVTSAVPVQQPLLTFLVEVDWGQGRLVREYSALIDTPQTAAAPVQPPIEEAVVGTQNTIVRPLEPVSSNPLNAEAPTAVPLDPKEVASNSANNGTNPLEASAPVAVPLPPPTEIPSTEPAPVVASVIQPVAPAQPLSTTADTHLVRRGETLGGIASRLGSGYTLDQTIVALLRANPEAFIGGNANRLKAGAVLRIPDSAGIAGYSPDEAALVMREQMAQWRGERRALPQPPAVVGVASDSGQTSAVQTAASAGAASAATRRVSQARLQIVPASASAAGRAATRSGISAGGKGDMLREQELLETKETLAARSVEVEELKARVAELENLKAQQEKLIALKDSELAAAQQRLASTDTTSPGTSKAAAASAATAAAPKQSEIAGFGPWLGVGAGLLAIGLLAAFWLRRKSAATRPSFALSSLGSTASAAFDSESNPANLTDADAEGPHFERDADSAYVPASASAAADEPAWSRGAPSVADVPAPAPLPLRNTAPTWHDPLNVSLDEAAASAEVASLNPTPPGLARIDLAKAYLEMGDRDTARALLREVSVLGDRASRDEATRLLRDLA